MKRRLLIAITLLVPAAAQKPAPAQRKNLSVPFVGCKSDGQVGPIDAPKKKPMSLPLSPKDAHDLAYYQAADGIGVLAPRGWHCFGTYGSAGMTLYVGPATIDAEHFLSKGGTLFAGPVIQLAVRSGETSGRFAVAQVI